MAYPNTSRPRGFTPLFMNGRTNSITVERPVAASRGTTAGGVTNGDLALGDAYQLDANGNAIRAGSGTVRGIVIGMRIAAAPGVMGASATVAGGGPLAGPGGPTSQDYIPAANPGTIIGIEDPGAEFEVQADTFAVTNIGGLFNLTDVIPDPTLRQSRQKLNVGGGAGTQFRAIDIVNRETDNAYGANAKVRVRLAQAFAD